MNPILRAGAALLLAACASGCAGRRDITDLPHSMKGYELYSWKAGPDWYFVLAAGTNRLKTEAEITSTKASTDAGGPVRLSVRGVSSLSKVLALMPRHEEIVWMLPERTRFRLPPEKTVDLVKAAAEEHGLVLSVPRP